MKGLIIAEAKTREDRFQEILDRNRRGEEETSRQVCPMPLLFVGLWLLYSLPVHDRFIDKFPSFEFIYSPLNVDLSLKLSECICSSRSLD